MDDRDFFDRLAPDWDDNEILSTPDKINHILDFMQIEKGMKILDLGTGTGVLLPYLAQRTGPHGEITAVDYSEGMLSRAREKFKDLDPLPEFLNLDFENENIKGEFDRIILYCVYPHLHTPFETLKWLSKVNLKENGKIFIAFPTGPDFINNIHRERHSESDLLPTASKLASWLTEAGFKAKAISDSSESYVVEIS